MSATSQSNKGLKSGLFGQYSGKINNIIVTKNGVIYMKSQIKKRKGIKNV